MNILFGTLAYHEQAQQAALALQEEGLLGRWEAGGVNALQKDLTSTLLSIGQRLFPEAEDILRRRAVKAELVGRVQSHWGWEAARLIAARGLKKPLFADWLWERSERRLSRLMARLIQGDNYDIVYGYEHGCLEALYAARSVGKKSIVGFVSPHHLTRESILEPEYRKFPELHTAESKILQELGRTRDARRDREAVMADFIECNSSFTARSLVEAGFEPQKIFVAPLGCPDAIPRERLPSRSNGCLRVLYAGTLSVHKGTHLLARAWKRLGVYRSAELHLYGSVRLPQRILQGIGENVFFHGSVSQAELFAAYEEASILCFPTLCDGFGLVIGEALAHGLPVLTTRNAGGADLIESNRNGVLIEAGNLDHLVEALDWSLRNPKLLHDMRASALETAQSNDWSAYRRKLRTTLREKLNLNYQ
ncbi:MAG: glycosyltransferase family 4 protein [Syntrophobacteraceae bacterium]|nr:glycosyltransferase family 4 protein [Syntrophobacteraceae bacterium]